MWYFISWKEQNQRLMSPEHKVPGMNIHT